MGRDDRGGDGRVMMALPDWERDPISVICAPVSGLLVTRISPWYAVQSATAVPGAKPRHPDSTRRANARRRAAG